MDAFGLELLTPVEMARADAGAIAAGVAGLDLMEAAGRAVADVAKRMVPARAHIVVLCGPGNNGGDGFVAARLLAEAGYRVNVALLGQRDHLQGDAGHMAARWSGSVVPLHARVVDGCDLIIDAIFGAGLNRDVSPEVGAVLASLARGAPPVLAVDVPTGVDGATGAVRGVSYLATRTVTFVRMKPGHLLLPGRALCGSIDVADIGVSDAVVAGVGSSTVHNRPALWAGSVPVVELVTHKYRRGHTLVVSGPAHATGASRLSARAALRVGAGAVSMAATGDAIGVLARHLTAIMIAPHATADALRASLASPLWDAVLIGPGVGVTPDTRGHVRAILTTGQERPTVLDADALTAFEQSREALFELTRANGRVVLTPHDGEFARLFGELPGSKLDRARAAAKLSGTVVVLKGADTVIADRFGRAAINDNAPPWLATAGSGDVLAGLIAGLLAQGMSTFEASCAAVWLHGAVGTDCGPGLIAEDLPERLPVVLRQFHGV
jgi:ADP-dependent NAD(P)H-hydrate dehydratase / NAD(P)H-hydrate epimerase